MNKPEQEETNNLFRDFTNKIICSAPSMRSSFESDPLNCSCPKKIESIPIEINGEISSPYLQNENGAINTNLIAGSNLGQINQKHQKKQRIYFSFE